jgi:Domain of unknown function (DUF4037)
MTNSFERLPFVPGMVLAEEFYREVVKPILDAEFPGLLYSAALIGQGSEVLGLDTDMSADHNWGPRGMLFLTPDDYASKKDAIHDIFSKKFPKTFRGYPTNFSEPDPEDNGTQSLIPSRSDVINHRVETFTLHGFFNDYLGIGIDKELESIDWLTLPQQKLLSIASGRVFHDGLGLEAIRQRFSWYPYDIWLYMLASVWARIGQDEHLLGRAGKAGDENGAAIIGARLARDIMRLAFLMERQYMPYSKWFGTAFTKLKSAAGLEPCITKALHAGSWKEIEKNLCSAYEIIAEMHNALKITEPLPAKVSRFWERPFKVIWGGKFAAAILKEIKDPRITPAMKRSPIGGIDIFCDNTDMLEDPAFRTVIRKLYE